MPVSPCLAVRHLAFVRQSLALPFQGWPRAQGLRGRCGIALAIRGAVLIQHKHKHGHKKMDVISTETVAAVDSLVP